mmetsp:Transcript_14783/g.30157  ORF Transcript_14783/g.30157 Transcript_14783/m.30157 type:complete len:240 (+) Transcript_14783:1341-2060(+)
MAALTSFLFLEMPSRSLMRSGIWLRVLESAAWRSSMTFFFASISAPTSLRAAFFSAIAAWISFMPSLLAPISPSFPASVATSFLLALSSSISLMSFFSSLRLMVVSCWRLARSRWRRSMSSSFVYLTADLEALASLMRESVLALSESRLSNIAFLSLRMPDFFCLSLLKTARAAPRGESFDAAFMDSILAEMPERWASKALIWSFSFSMSDSCFSLEGRSTFFRGLERSTTISNSSSTS